MPSDFLPQYSAMQVGRKYRPIYRLFVGQNWRQIYRDKEPVTCETSAEAIEIAKQHVIAILNPKIRAEHPDAAQTKSHDELFDVERWKQERQRSHEEELAEVFGAGKGKTIFLKGGRQVKVERKKKVKR